MIVQKDPAIVNQISESILYLGGAIDEESAASVINWLLEVNMHPDKIKQDEQDAQVLLMINSEGGCMSSCLSILDAMDSSEIPIITYGTGLVCSAAFLILANGMQGYRSVSRNCQLMMHQPLVSIQDKYHDVQNRVAFDVDVYDRMVAFFQQKSNLDGIQIKNLLLGKVELWGFGEKFKGYGLVDRVENLKFSREIKMN